MSDNMDNLVKLNMQGYDYVLPMEDAFAVVKALSKAERLDSTYVSGAGYTYYTSSDKPSCTISLLVKEHYLEAMINGVKPKAV